MKEKIEHFIRLYEDRNGLLDDFQSLFGVSDDSRVFELFSMLDDYMLTLLEEVIGDDDKWVEWYIYENDCGGRGFEAGYDGIKKPINSVDDLVELIRESKMRGNSE